MTDMGWHRPMGTQPRRGPGFEGTRLDGVSQGCPSHEGVPTTSRVPGALGPPHGQAVHPLFMGSDHGGKDHEDSEGAGVPREE